MDFLRAARSRYQLKKPSAKRKWSYFNWHFGAKLAPITTKSIGSTNFLPKYSSLTLVLVAAAIASTRT
jgi:hypothetical protein